MMQQMMMCGMCDIVKPCNTINTIAPQKEDMQVVQRIKGFPILFKFSNGLRKK